jgi:hypothetical protein
MRCLAYPTKFHTEGMYFINNDLSCVKTHPVNRVPKPEQPQPRKQWFPTFSTAFTNLILKLPIKTKGHKLLAMNLQDVTFGAKLSRFLAKRPLGRPR